MELKEIVFYTIVGDSHYHGCRTDEFIESFKLFHPDIDLIVFRFSVISSPINPSPRVAPRKNIPFS